MSDQGRYYSEETVAGLRKQVDGLKRERDEAIALLRRWAAGPMEEDRAALHRETATLIRGQDD